MKTEPPFETLDPEDWNALRDLAHRMVDESISQLENVADGPVWQAVPEVVQARFKTPLPPEPDDIENVYQEFVEYVRPYPMGNTHPRFWAWYMGAGTVTGALADFLAAIMNPNHGGGHHAAIMVEEQVVNWMKEVVGFPADASGLLVSGGSVGNLVGLTVARNHMAGFDVRREGLQGRSPRMTLYASTEVHSCNPKAAELLGLGSDQLRRIPARADYTLDLEALQQAIARDRRDGFHPVCVIATSGTVNTGAIDDLDAVADLCEREGLWFHIDGAIGAVAMLADNVKGQLRGIERADSIAMDLHKWLHIPFEAACVLVRHRDAHRETFSVNAEYLEKTHRGIASGELWFSEYGVQLSRSFRALKVWMTLKEHGSRRMGRMIARNVDQARYLGEKISAEPRLELVAPVGLDIVCYRFNPGEGDLTELNELNREIILELQEQGIAAPSYTTLDGVYCIRVAICNHRSRYEDFDLLVTESVRIGEALRA